ncbi:energy transducer TonB [Opitutus terrae]|nr:energy transducer TonB [Opitutus terrae]
MSSFATLAALAAASDYDELPVPVKSVAPTYPPEMKQEKASGIVMVKISIDENGDVVDRVVAKSTRAEFDEAALAAISKWKFKPAKKDGAAVKATVTIPIKFTAES